MQDPGERVAWVLLNECTLWTPGMPGQVSRWGLRVVPCVQPVGARGDVRPLVETEGVPDGELTDREADDTVLVYAQNRPGDYRAAHAYGLRFVMNVEASSWDGDASEAVEALSIARECAIGSGYGPGVDDGARRLCAAVTGHGYILRSCQRAMRALGEAGLIGLPQVYDADASADPVQFTRACIKFYRDAGFKHVAPIIGVGMAMAKAGSVRDLQACAETCEDMGCNYHLWRYGQVAEGSPALRAWVKAQAGVRASALGVQVPMFTPADQGPPVLPPRPYTAHNHRTGFACPVPGCIRSIPGPPAD